jgi:hypothetical protein
MTIVRNAFISNGFAMNPSIPAFQAAPALSGLLVSATTSQFLLAAWAGVSLTPWADLLNAWPYPDLAYSKAYRKI